MKIIKLISLFLFVPLMLAMAQKTPAIPTHIDVKERTIQDLLYFPFTCINAYMPTKSMGILVYMLANPSILLIVVLL